MGLILTMYKHGDGINEFRSFRAKQHMKIFTYVGAFLESTEEGVRKAEEKGAEVVLKGWCVLWWNLSVQVIFHKVSVSAVIFKNALFLQR